MRVVIGGNHNRSSASSSLKFLVKSTVILSLLCSALDQLNIHFFGFSSTSLFLLNHFSITNFFLWQPFTSIFLHSVGPISIGTIFNLLTPIYFLWTFGKSVEQLLGTRGLLYIYFISGLIAALSSLSFMYLTGEFISVSCASAAILGLCVVWAISFNYHSQSLLMLMPFSGRWILILALCGTVGAELLDRNLPAAIGFFTAFLTSYILAVFYFGFQGPMKTLWPIENFLKVNYRKYKAMLAWKIRTGIVGRMVSFILRKKSQKKDTDIVKFH